MFDSIKGTVRTGYENSVILPLNFYSSGAELSYRAESQLEIHAFTESY